MTVDKEATKYIGLAIEWDYENRKAYNHMPGYLEKAFTRFKHKAPGKNQNSPHPHVILIPQYGAKTQYAKDKDMSPPLSKEETKYVQAVKQLPGRYYTAREQSTQQSLWRLVRLQPNKEN
jgi:hypothetical protein